ncbi:MAG TPA: TIM-barrel domain-containing protein, partial [Balneolales bacterium]|nr:TIM-barrel domain-containing protein [Balneolales bacterium]
MSDCKWFYPKKKGVSTKWLVIALLPVFLFSCSRTKSGSTVIAGNARFEFLTPSLVRMEYSPSGQFLDAPTAVIQKRKWPAVKVESTKKSGWLTAITGQMRLRYKLNSGSFKADNLTITWHDTTGSHSWHPGEKDSLNLGGVYPDLGGIHKGDLPKPEPGLLSRSGYAFLNDSHTPVWNEQNQWIEARKQKNNQDWYLFTYGRDYMKVLNEYAELSGYIPMIPRYTLGPWITDMNFEYFPNSYQSQQPDFKKYNEQHLKNEILKFRHNNIPLDILVMDFGWHNYGWQGGYDWSPLIPKPKQFLSWLHDHGIKVSLNDHPGYAGTKESILSYEDSHAPEVLKDLGRTMPPKPTFNMDLSSGWKFAVDPHDRGVSQDWFSSNYSDSHWKTIKVGRSWENAGYKNYNGIAWYRKSVHLPSELSDSLYLYLGKVNNSFQVYVNGRKVSHSSATYFRPTTYANITPYIKAGDRNELAIRVTDEHGNGGITRTPVAIRDTKPPKRIHFDLSNKKQAEVFMNDLHKPLIKEGVNFWWIDGGNGAVSMPGLNKQMWTNRVYYDYTQKETGKRSFIFSRYGGWGSQRYPAFFTGDTHSQWAVLAYEVPFTARGGNVLSPYITHDIGGFHGAKIPFDLYARWVEFGTFSPILRMHSAHENPYEGNVRMPWTYGKKGIDLDKKYFTLRIQMI